LLTVQQIEVNLVTVMALVSSKDVIIFQHWE